MLSLFNTASQKIEEFYPLTNNKVTLYVCGITPYDTTHLGHAFTYITFDSLVKYLAYKKYHVVYTQNVTDINDRDTDILQRAKDQNTSWENLAEYWTDRFLKDMSTLHWTKPTHYVWASHQISEMIALIQRILANGYAYEKNGSVYVDITTYPRYGSLSKLSTSEMLTLAKDFEEDLDNPEKKHPLDITLWRASSLHQPSHIPSFQSPFGLGRPGWHIECSAMSTSTLGDQIDIHGGGLDLIYPHHESELTQSETATGKVPFVKYWMHVAIVMKDNEKMSKSKGNLILISDLLKKYSANAIRYVLLSHHYRTSWNFDETELMKAEEMVEKLKRVFHSSHPSIQLNESIMHRFEEAMEIDLNTPQALEILKEAISSDIFASDDKSSYSSIAHILGLVF